MISPRRWVNGTIAAMLLASATVVVSATADPAPPVAQAAEPRPLPVVARYDMNEGSGASTMNDGGPHNLDGAVGNLVTTGATFAGATGYRFTPESPTNPITTPASLERIVTVPDDPRLDPGTGDYAIEFRYRTTRSFGNVLQKGQNTTFGGYWKFEQPNGLMTCLFKDADGRTLGVKAKDTPERTWHTNNGQWHTIRCERRANFGVILFINGVEAAKNGNDPLLPLGSVSNSKELSIGGKASCNQNTGIPPVTCDYFNGDIDYVQIEKGGTPVPPPNQPPAMTFSVECVVFDCEFDASESTDPDGDIVSWSWNWGDGSPNRIDDDPLDQHRFRGPGTYTVVVTGTDDDGATGTATEDVNPASPNAPPTMAFTASCTELTCSFDSSGSTDADGTIDSRSWEFGDGTTSSDLNPTHTYDAPGDYTVILTGVDDDDASADTSRTVTVEQQASLPPLVGTTRLIPLPPERVFDTREGTPGAGPKALVSGGTTIDVDVTALDGIPADPAAVAINVTAIAQEPGFVTIWPTGLPRPTASSINLTASGQVRANLVIVPVGTDGKISLFSLGDAHLLGDIAGYFADQTTAIGAGRIITQSPQRLFDTRPGEPGNGPKGGVVADGTIEVRVLGEGGLPATGVSAVVLNVTATAPAGPGFVTVWSGEGTRPTASIINLTTSGETVPNQVIVPVNPNGTITFFSSTATQLLADVSGYVTDATAAPAVSGLFVPLPPDRLFDTRPGEPGGGPKGQVPAEGTITPQIAEVAGVPADAGAVVVNLTMIGTAPSFATAWPAGGLRPVASIVNLGGSDVRANGAMIALGDGGDISVFVSAAADLLADVSGYLLR